MSYLGVDVGTTGCKAAAFDAAGRLLALAYREYPLLASQPGWAELDSRRVMDDCEAAIAEVAAKTTADPIRALAISSQGEAFTPLAADGRLLGNGMVSSDARAAALAERFPRDFGAQRLYESTGHTAHPMFTLFKLLWLKEHQPRVWSQAARFYCFEELLQSRLGVEPAISWPLAGRTMLFDVRSHRWDPAILGALGLDEGQLARTAPSGTVVGMVPASTAAKLGLPTGVKVVCGGHDQTCGALGAGAVRPGLAMYASGTVECICPAFSQPIFDDRLMRANLCTYDYTAPPMYTTVLFSLTGGNLLRWFRDEWATHQRDAAVARGADPYDAILAELPDEPTDLLVLPYFTPSGTPYFDAQLPGAILGLRMATGRGAVLRALLEGVAMEMRLNIEILAECGLPIEQLRGIGGGAKSRRLVQLKADVAGRPITTLAVTEAACLGAALLAATADGEATATELAASWVQPLAAVEPDAARAARYDEQFARYRLLYPRLKGLWQELYPCA